LKGGVAESLTLRSKTNF